MVHLFAVLSSYKGHLLTCKQHVLWLKLVFVLESPSGAHITSYHIATNSDGKYIWLKYVFYNISCIIK